MPDGRPGCSACRESRLGFDFTMAFQPIIDLPARRIDGHEALVRGLQGEGAATVLGRLDATTLYAFDQACRVKAIEMAAALGLEGGLSINFLPRAVYEPKACISLTLAAADRSGFPLDRLTFEFTETEEILDIAHLRAIIAEYRRHGFRVAMDDFGTGYSGLERLAELRPDIVKLDRALVQGIDRDRLRQAIVASMAALGAEAGIKVIAEGVERPDEAASLADAGVRYMQGFLFARPVFQGVARTADIAWPSPALKAA